MSADNIPQEMMPVLSAARMGDSPKEIPMEWLSDDMANANHSQTLKRLKERGGMSCAEIWLNIHKQGLRNLPSETDAINYLNNRLKKYTMNTPQEEPIPEQVKSDARVFAKTCYSSPLQKDAAISGYYAAYRHLSPRIKQLEADLFKMIDEADQKSKHVDALRRQGVTREEIQAVKCKLEGDKADYLTRAEAEGISRYDDFEAGFMACIRRMNGILNIKLKSGQHSPIDPQPIPVEQNSPNSMRYRKIPVEVRAVQWRGNNRMEIESFVDRNLNCSVVPYQFEWDTDDIPDEAYTIEIPTREGIQTAIRMDWIIEGQSEEHGKHYWVNKPDYFKKAYEPIK